MSGKNSQLNVLASRRRLLVAESELNRSHLSQEMGAMTGGVHALAARVKSIGSIASVVAVLVVSLAALRRAKSGTQEAKPSWWSTLFKSAGLLPTLWTAFRSHSGHSKEQQQNT